jgi:uncharacterized protein YcbX
MAPHLARIDLFPIKALDGVTVTQAQVLASGALAGDRTYALFDQHQRFINGKHNEAVHRLRAHFSADLAHLSLQVEGEQASATFELTPPHPALEAWLQAYFQQPVTVQSNPDEGFPDDTEAAGPTVISTATLTTVASWYPPLTVDDLRRRLRTNLEIDDVPPFWEDQLFSADPQHPVRFTIGNVTVEGVNPCQRCVVPTRHPSTGTVTPHFQRRFTQQRQATLPPWTHPGRFNHFYRLAINTNIRDQSGQVLRVGDPVALPAENKVQ